jgi:FkbM family methyltransferase
VIRLLENWRHGRLLMLDNDLIMGQGLLNHGEYSEEEVQLLCSLLRPGDVAIDAGANIGCMTIPMARTGAGVIAVEPQRYIYHMLCGSIALNGLSKQVTAIHGALGLTAGRIGVPAMDYDKAGGNFGGLALAGTIAAKFNYRDPVLDGVVSDQVPVYTVDDLCLRALRLLKADVEGMEVEILRGAQKSIAQFRPYLYIEAEHNELCERLLGTMFDLEYKLYWHMPSYFPKGSPLFQGQVIISRNVLGVPKEIETEVGLVPVSSPQDRADVAVEKIYSHLMPT